MYSQCPECHARFRVTAAALKAANGTVRCGRCGGAFNALATLSDTVPAPVAAEPLPLAAQSEGAGVAAPRDAQLGYATGDLEQVFLESGGWIGGDAAASTTLDAATGEAPVDGGEPPVLVSEGEPFEDITLEGERIRIESLGELDMDFDAEELGRDLDSTDEFEVIDNVPGSAWPEDAEDRPAAANADAAAGGAADEIGGGDAAPPPADAKPPGDALDVLLEAPATRAAPPAAAADVDDGWPAAITAGTPADLRWHRNRGGDDAPTSTPARGRSVAWAVGSLVLVLALVAQVVHQYRQQLVRHPQVGPTLRAAYDGLGLPLSPNWDVGAFELRQWGNDELPGATGRLTVRASLTNRASFAQPHPLLRLEFDDRYGEAVATRDFKPAEYLKSSAEASRLLAPGGSADVELVIVDPGKDAVGYQLDVCLPESPKVLRCARGPG